MSKSKSPKVPHVPMEVVQDKLLVALDDEGKVAIVLGKEEVAILIRALRWYSNPDHVLDNDDVKYAEKAKEMLEGVKTLYARAFGEGDSYSSPSTPSSSVSSVYNRVGGRPQ